MLLPGPEAMQLATYIGWRLHGTIGGLAAGLLFVLPGALVILTLSVAYAYFGRLPLVEVAFVGIKAAVIGIVIEALLRVAKRSLKRPIDRLIAAAAFVAHLSLRPALPFDHRRSGAGRITSLEPADCDACRIIGASASSSIANLAHGRAVACDLDRPAASPCPDPRPQSHYDRYLNLLLQTRHGDFRRRLLGAGLYGAAGGRDLSLAHGR